MGKVWRNEDYYVLVIEKTSDTIFWKSLAILISNLKNRTIGLSMPLLEIYIPDTFNKYVKIYGRDSHHSTMHNIKKL